MVIAEPDFWEYVLISDDGELIGLAEDAPENIKASFKAYLDTEKRLTKQNICGSLDLDALLMCYNSLK